MSAQKEKLGEAEFFFNLMMKHYNEETYKEFNYVLSAFLSSSRSVLQYTRDVAKSTGKLSTYDSIVASRPILAYFKEKRDFNIHRAPIKVSQHVKIESYTIWNIQLQTSARITKISEDGTILDYESKNNSGSAEHVEEKHSDCLQATRTFSFRFDDWMGNEDVISVCLNYLKELKGFIVLIEVQGLTLD